MAKPDMGTKRQCQACGTKFFDMNRSKIVCPKCSTVFQATPPARGAAAAARAAVPDDDEKEVETEADTVSLEEADAPEDAAVVADEAEDDDAPADTFLEEEEEDGDDVSGLIDGDIETDEEP